MLQAYLFGRGSFDDGSAGLRVDGHRKFMRGWSAFAQAELGYGWTSEKRGASLEALAGLRMRW